MHDIWNPWHGCVKISEGCDFCYMYAMDRKNGKNGADIYRTKNMFDYPLHKDRKGHYKIQSGELIRVCMTSDFFLPEADEWRDDIWQMMKIRSDVTFFILTKRPERVTNCLPDNWGDGWDNIFFNVTCENQKRAEERIPLLLSLPFKHKGIMCAPFIGKVEIDLYLKTKQIEQVICGGENYDGARPCDFKWVQSLSTQCKAHNVSFCFIETGTKFVKDKKTYNLPSKRLQSEMAQKANVNYLGKQIKFNLTNQFGASVLDEELYQPHYRKNCLTCGSKQICNGCSDCGRCNEEILDEITL